MLTTHYMEEAEALSDRIAIMKDGRIIICDTAQNIKVTAGVDNFEKAFIYHGAQTDGYIGNAYTRVVDAAKCRDVLLRIY